MTLIEIIVVIFIIVLFSLIVISDFPKIKRQFALSNSAYQLAQDLRQTQDLGLSGVQVKDSNGQPITVRGYGVYASSGGPAQYVIYADVPDESGSSDQKYGGGSGGQLYPLCDQVDQTGNNIRLTDCVIKIVDLTKEDPGLYIKDIKDADNLSIFNISVNFSPPNPVTAIKDGSGNTYSGVGIVLGLTDDNSATRTVWVNTSGLINVQ